MDTPKDGSRPVLSRGRRAWLVVMAAVIGSLGVMNVTDGPPWFGWAQLAFAAACLIGATIPRIGAWLDAPVLRHRKRRDAQLSARDRG